MSKEKLLEKLENLFEEANKGFPSQQACIDWSNKVAPLLTFNEQYYENFIQNAHKMNLRLSSYTLVPALNIMKSQVQMAIEQLKMEIEQGAGADEGEQEIYIDKTRRNELIDISNKDFDLSKLVKIIDEMNICYNKECYFSVIMLTRALIDHVPPIFGCKTFSEVANNYKGTKSFKESMEHLDKSSSIS